MEVLKLILTLTFATACKPYAEQGARLAAEDSLAADTAALQQKNQTSVFIDSGERDDFGRPVIQRVDREQAMQNSYGTVIAQGEQAYYTQQAKEAIRGLERTINLDEGRATKSSRGAIQGSATQTKYSDEKLKAVLQSAVNQIDQGMRHPNDRLQSYGTALSYNTPDGSLESVFVPGHIMNQLIETRAAKAEGLIDPGYVNNPFANPFLSIFDQNQSLDQP